MSFRVECAHLVCPLRPEPSFRLFGAALARPLALGLVWARLGLKRLRRGSPCRPIGPLWLRSLCVASLLALAGVFVLPAAVDAGPVSGRAQVAAAVAARRRNGTWRLPAFRTNGDRRLFLRLSKVAALAAALPPAAVSFMLGPQGFSQVGASDARALVMRLLEDKAGPESEVILRSLPFLPVHQRNPLPVLIC